MSTPKELWARYKEYLFVDETIDLTIDVSRMSFAAGFLAEMEPRLQRAYAAMDELEKGAIANPDENRMVGHYWLRAPELAPDPALGKAITDTVARVKQFAIAAHGRAAWRNVLVVGIGGSALGPQFVGAALTTPDDHMRPYFLDNTDPDGMDRTLTALDGKLSETLTLVISKSGGTKETRNGMLEVADAYKRAGLDFARHAIAVTGEGSELDKVAVAQKWLDRFPMWDWVGGRTSVLSAVGLLPAALQGISVDGLLQGAREMDVATRRHETRRNPAALLALMWFHATGGRGKKDMVLLPYKDRLELFSRYLQQLVMESIGKERNLRGEVVNQGIAVYGNKGSTDQHAYVQQLRDGVNNFFVTFLEVLRDRNQRSLPVEPGVTSGDYLSGFFQGTRRALFEGGRESITITIPRIDAAAIGGLIALYERAVGLYASLVDVNAYHQPGVEAGKKAAGAVLSLQSKILTHLVGRRGQAQTADQVAEAIGAADEVETVFKILEHAAANPDHDLVRQSGKTPFDASYLVR